MQCAALWGWAMGLAAAVWAGAESGPEASLTIDAREPGAVIAPALFGHNLEVTRRAVWSGLSAEQVANRKFAAAANGRPKQWQPVGGADVLNVDTNAAYAGKQSARIDVPAAGTPAGAKQQQALLAVSQGKSYAFRLWLKTEQARRVCLRLTGDAKTAVVEQTFSCRPGDWQLLRGKFTASATQTNGTLEITSAEPGAFWLGAVSLQPADAFHGLRRDVVELLKQIGPGCLRFPGGCYAEFYRWEDGLLPVDQRPPIGPTGLWFLLPNTDDYDTHEIGVDEFMALCREVGAEPVLTLRLSENTPASAAAWVEYCNGGAKTRWGGVRAARGQKKPYGVRTWCVGNELYGFGRGGLNQPQQCAQQSKLFAEAVKQADASVDLVGCTDLVYGNIKMGWNKPLLEQAGPLLTYVSYHDYLRDSAKPKDLPAYAALAARHLRPAFENMRKVLNKPVVMDEWNTMWGLPGSVGMELCVAGVLNLLGREGAALGVRQACFFQPITEGAIRVTPLTAELDTAGHVFDLFKVHQGNRVVKVSGRGAVDTCASLTPDGKRLYLTAVNGAGAEQAVTFVLADGTVARKAAAEVCYLTPRSLRPEETVLDRKAEPVRLEEGRRLQVKIPAGGVVRIAWDIRKPAP